MIVIRLCTDIGWITVPTGGAAMLKSTAVLDVSLALVNAVPALPLSTARRLRLARVAFPRMVRRPPLPRRTSPRSLARVLLLPTLPTLPRLSSLARRLRRLRTQPTPPSLPPLQLPRLSPLTSRLQLLLHLQAQFLRTLLPQETRPRLHPTMVLPLPLLRAVAVAVAVKVAAKTKEDHTSRPSKAMVLTIMAGPAKTSGFPSTLCGRSTNPS
jgi:hypothetical protein